MHNAETRNKTIKNSDDKTLKMPQNV